jgi:hypothetical protein
MADQIDDLFSDILDKPVADVPEVTSYARESFAWAEDVFWCFENLGGSMTKKKAGSNARHALWTYAKNNMDQFMGQVLPKAMQLLEKAKAKEGDSDEIIRAETKSIASLRKLLKLAVEESERIE